MAAPDSIVADKGLRRPWTMIAAEALAWVPVAFACVDCADLFWRAFRHDEFEASFYEVLTVFALLAWFVSVPVFIRRGRRVWTTFVLVFELIVWNACFFVQTCMNAGNAILLSTCLLLWLPPSVRWSTRRDMKNWVRYFADNPLSRNWFDIVDPSVVSGIATVDIGKPEYLGDRKAIKSAFKAFGLVVNAVDGLSVRFPAASAGKMLYQSGVDIHGIAGAFKTLFESSIRVWNEREVPMEGHKFHFNVGAYRNYLNKFTDGKAEYYIRFTVREIGKDSSVHASTISEVAIYGKDEGAAADSHPKNSEDGHKAPFIDNKIAFYLSYVNGGMNGK